jgi:hypothetical protein
MHYLWDPIGVARMPQTRDEYDSYLPTVVGMLMRGAKKEEISGFLTRTATETMGLSATPQGKAHDEDIAELLIEHYTVVAEKYEKEG